jgi:hypothetical protein
MLLISLRLACYVTAQPGTAKCFYSEFFHDTSIVLVVLYPTLIAFFSYVSISSDDAL